MGQEVEYAERKKTFKRYQVNEAHDGAREAAARSSCTACPPIAARKSATK